MGCCGLAGLFAKHLLILPPLPLPMGKSPFPATASCPRQSERPLRGSAGVEKRDEDPHAAAAMAASGGPEGGGEGADEGEGGSRQRERGRGVDEVGDTPQGRESQRRGRPHPAGTDQIAQTAPQEQQRHRNRLRACLMLTGGMAQRQRV